MEARWLRLLIMTMVDVQGDWVATLDQVLALDFDTVIPGHGPLLRKSEIRIFRDKFEQMLARIRGLMDSGVSRDDIAAELDISDLNWPLAPDRCASDL